MRVHERYMAQYEQKQKEEAAQHRELLRQRTLKNTISLDEIKRHQQQVDSALRQRLPQLTESMLGANEYQTQNSGSKGQRVSYTSSLVQGDRAPQRQQSTSSL